MAAVSVQEHIKLSGQLTMLLHAGVNDFRLTLEILGTAPPPPHEKAMLAALRFTRKVYGDDRRKLRTLSVLHPCRVAGLVARCELENGRYSREAFDVLDYLVGLTHDLEEDIPSDRLDTARPEFNDLLGVLDDQQRWFMRERVHMLSRRPGQPYFDYLCSLLRTADDCINPVRVKCADKLDSVLDLFLATPTVSMLDFYLTIFEILCVPNYRGLPAVPEPPVGRKLVELFVSNLVKALIWISLLRQSPAALGDRVVRRLSELLLEATIRQTETILLCYLMERVPLVSRQQDAIKAGIEYCQDPEAVTTVTPSSRGRLLDGSILEELALQTDDKTRKRHIRALYEDPVRFTALLFVMIAVLRSCANDKTFYIRGVSMDGVRVPGS